VAPIAAVNRLARKLAGGMLVIGVGVALWAPAASAAVVHCGDVLTTNTTFGNDVGCNGVNGVSIGADGIVVDLNGHAILGEFPYAIHTNGHSRVTIRNGTIQTADFSTNGIVISGGTNNTISDMKLLGGDFGETGEGTRRGILVTGGARRTTVIGTRVRDWLEGIVIVGAGETTLTYDVLESNFCIGLVADADPAGAGPNAITHNTVSDTQDGPGIAVGAQVLGDTHACIGARDAGGEWSGTLSRNTAINNGAGLPSIGDNGDFIVGGATSSTVIANNVAVGANGPTVADFPSVMGFTIRAAPPAPGTSRLLVSQNRATHAYAGFSIAGDGVDVRGNTAEKSITNGFNVDGNGMHLIGNVAGNPTALATNLNNGNTGNGFEIGGTNMHLSGNNANRNGGDGVHIGAATNTELTSNIAGRNGANGIRIDGPSATLTSNRATYNGGFGILAALGNTDGGGNVAYGNALGQCQNVFCTP
jgi:hypothetical protein